MNSRLLGLSLLIGLALAGCGKQDEPDSGGPAQAGGEAGGEGRVVNVYNWTDYIDESVLADFTRETGIRVVYDVYESNEVLDAKLTTGGSGYDVVFPSARPFADRQIQTGALGALDRSLLPAAANLEPAILAGLTDIDAGNQHVLPYMWGTTGLGINLTKVRALLGENAPTDSWALLFDPQYSDKLKECGISVLDDEQEGIGAAMIWLGRNPNAYTAQDSAAVVEAWNRVRPNLLRIQSTGHIESLAGGELCVALAYSGDIYQAMAKAEEAGMQDEIVYVIPREGAMRWVDVMGVPADAPHRAEAHAFMDFLMRPDIAARNANYVAYASPNAAARPQLDPELAADPGVYPPAEVVAKLVDPVTLGPDIQRERTRSWTRIRSGQ
jgi:putrescine transport system substrate-binding protein